MKNFIIVLSLFICSLLHCDLATAEEQDNFKEVYAKIDRLSFEEFADWPEMKIPDYRFAKVYEAWVAPARPSEFCRGLLEWTGKDAATAAMLRDVIGQLNPEETAQLALSALRWASLRPALAIVSLATKRFPKDYRQTNVQVPTLATIDNPAKVDR